MLRVAELVRHTMSELLTRGSVSDAVLEGHVTTISKVQMSPDLKCATVFVLPLGSKDNDAVLAALDKHRKTFRAEVAGRINLKFAPDLRFRLDDSFDNGAAIDSLLNSPKVRQDTAKDDIPDKAAGHKAERPASNG
jgi:ribosome-binding factor A